MTSGIASGLNKRDHPSKPAARSTQHVVSESSSRTRKPVNIVEMPKFTSLIRNLAPERLRQALYPALTHQALSRALSGLNKPEPPPSSGPLIVSGFFDEPSGIGRAASLTVRALQEAGLLVDQMPLRPLLQQRCGRLPAESAGAWILHCNPAEAARALAYIDPREWRGRRRIGYWAWELPVAPLQWARIAPLFHEIWTPSRFVADALCAGGVQVPIRVMPHPVWTVGAEQRRDRPRFGWDETDFVVLALGDLRSSITRKNLSGAVEIYKRAFQDDGRSRLLIRALATGTRTALSPLDIGARSDIAISSNPLAASEIAAMIASADVVLSPHRSEGFGLSLAEAMMFGVPPLATGWSGNLDFMRLIPELLIDYRLVKVEDQTGIYRAPDQRWAEPDIEDGARKLRSLAASADLRASLAEKGRENLLRLSCAWSPRALSESALGGVVI